jgi:hypothetical protein
MMPDYPSDFEEISYITLGLVFSWFLSNPKSPARTKLPVKVEKNIILSPNVIIERRKRYYHLHHWMYAGTLYLLLRGVRKQFVGKRVTQGFLLGIILQGLTYADRFKVKVESNKPSL